MALKENADAAVADTPSIEHVVVARRTGDAGGATPMRTAATTGGTT